MKIKYLAFLIIVNFSFRFIFCDQKIYQTQQELEKTKKTLQKKKKEKENYLLQRKKVEVELKKIEKELKNIEKEKKEIEDQIKNLKTQISFLMRKLIVIEADLEFYKRILNIFFERFIKKYFLVSLLFEENFKKRIYGNIFECYVQQIYEIRQKKIDFMRVKKDLEVKQEKLTIYQNQLILKNNKQKALFLEKNKLLDEIKIKEKNVDKEIKELLVTQRDLENLLKKLKEQKRKEKIIITPVINRKFPKPINGEIVSKFGKRYISKDGSCLVNNGVVIQGISYDKVVAVEDGKVLFISNNFRSYGRIVIIEHKDNIHTIYAKLGKILILEGESVYKGQQIAETDYTGQIYFELRKDFTPLDPEIYFE